MAQPGIAGHTALLIAVHLSGPLAARMSGRAHMNSGIIEELARRYSHDYDPQSATYDFMELAVAAGLKVSSVLEFRLKQLNSSHYLGKGQFEQVGEAARGGGVELIAVGAPLTPVQQRNWEQELKLPVLSRYDIIFSIFEQNAHTAEGKLQVELARLRYELPRIVRSYEQLDPLAGGIGTLGPGEQLTERIKRRHRERIHEIEERLGKLRNQRALRRRQRERSGVFIASIVGYTNVGKSTLLNRLTGSGVLVADQYFATLDPTARALVLPAREVPQDVLQDSYAPPPRILLTDTVGFLDDLPGELVQSFRATLEEMEGANLLIHLADASHSRVDAQIAAVRKIVREIGLGDTPELLVFNKCDRVDQAGRAGLAQRFPEALQISAATGHGVGSLLEAVQLAYYGHNQ